jgi:hypothetical protein
MALMLSRLYDALRLANVPEDKAREAAEEVATYEQLKSDTYLLKWMVGFLIAIVLGVFWMQWQTIVRLGDLQGGLSGVQVNLNNLQGQLTRLEDRFTGMEGQLAGVDGRLGNVESRLTSVESRLGGVEGRLDAIDGRRSQP